MYNFQSIKLVVVAEYVTVTVLICNSTNIIINKLNSNLKT